MSDHLARTVAEVARRLAGQAIEDGRYDLGGADRMARATVVSGRIEGRSVLVDFFDRATLSVRLPYSGPRTFRIVPASVPGGNVSFRRRVRSGDATFDDRFRVEHEAGPPPDDLLARPGFLAVTTALAPFEEIAVGNGLVRLVTLYDSESLLPDDVLDRVASLAALAAAAEAPASSRA